MEEHINTSKMYLNSDRVISFKTQVMTIAGEDLEKEEFLCPICEDVKCKLIWQLIEVFKKRKPNSKTTLQFSNSTKR